MKKFLTLLFALCFLLGCNKEDLDKEDPIVTQISFDTESLTLQIGSSITLNVNHAPSDLVAPIYSWKSSNSNVISITQTGVVSAIELGDATITVTTETGLTASCIVIVSPIEATSIKLSANDLALNVGDSHELTYEIAPDDTTDKTVVWSSSNKTVATVENGVITAKAEGECMITANVNGNISDNCNLIVNTVPITAIYITPQTTTIDIGAYCQFEYTIQPANATDQGLVWNSSDTSIATVLYGKCLGIKEGVVNITVETEDGSVMTSAELAVKDMYPYCEIGKSYTSKYGFDIIVNSITASDDTSTQKTTCAINYTITNITSDNVLSEITFQCKKQSGEYEAQYGFFGDLYPNESTTRSYTFSSLVSDPFVRLELNPLFWNDIIDSTQSELIWKVE